MSAAEVTWKLLRVSRWVLWLAFLGYCFYVHTFREVLNNQFGHLPFATELIIFGLATAAVCGPLGNDDAGTSGDCQAVIPLVEAAGSGPARPRIVFWKSRRSNPPAASQGQAARTAIASVQRP